MHQAEERRKNSKMVGVKRDPTGKTLLELRANVGEASPKSSTTSNSSPRNGSDRNLIIKTTTRHGRPVITILLAMNLVALLYLIHLYSQSIIPASSEQQVDTNRVRNILATEDTTGTHNAGWIRPSHIYGLIHVAKTVGTEINGMLSMQSERVCGNKGYSFDAYEANKRYAQFKINKTAEVLHVTFPIDYISSHQRGWGRNRVPFKLMKERGWDDCDYIALEEDAKEWEPIYNTWGPMELHVPCREPLEHLMSMCNYKMHTQKKNVTFDCNNATMDEAFLKKQIWRCTVHLERMSEFFVKRPSPNRTLKCFDPVPPQHYVGYMNTILEPKRNQDEYTHHPTNTHRDRNSECVWKQPQEWQDYVRMLMRKHYYYYRFCGECMGTNDELPITKAKTTTTNAKSKS